MYGYFDDHVNFNEELSGILKSSWQERITIWKHLNFRENVRTRMIHKTQPSSKKDYGSIGYIKPLHKSYCTETASDAGDILLLEPLFCDKVEYSFRDEYIEL
eukprot:snap_masked-scaffold_11-processed-gene-12.40-mRNA-1 protein AED:1.00 eAED:1.00 QI:0/0/0/0/1/1/2/0/101